MTNRGFYVITEPCIGAKDGSCTRVCPVECISPGDDQYYINPDECVECGACVPVCPVNAVFNEAVVPPVWKAYVDKNAAFFKSQQSALTTLA